MTTQKGEWRGTKFRRLVEKKLGGSAAVAAAIGCREQTVINWFTKPKGPYAIYMKRLCRLLEKKLGWSYKRVMDELLPE